MIVPGRGCPGRARRPFPGPDFQVPILMCEWVISFLQPTDRSVVRRNVMFCL